MSCLRPPCRGAGVSSLLNASDPLTVADLSVLSLPQTQRAGGTGCVTHVSADCLFLCWCNVLCAGLGPGVRRRSGLARGKRNQSVRSQGLSEFCSSHPRGHRCPVPVVWGCCADSLRPGPATFLGPECSQSAASFHSDGPLSFIHSTGAFVLFSPVEFEWLGPWVSRLHSQSSPFTWSPWVPGSRLLPEVHTSQHGCGIHTVRPLFIFFCFYFENRGFPWRAFSRFRPTVLAWAGGVSP